MISQFTIRNFGLIESLSVDFCPGLNIFTGETGAGKSILIDALRFALGDRISPVQVRNPEIPSTVEAVFELPDKLLTGTDTFSEYVSPEDAALIINRTYSPDGRTKNKINGFAVTTSQLKALGNHLIDFHGAHDHQMLLSESSHISILDRLACLGELKNEYLEKYGAYLHLKKQLNELSALAGSRERELDLLSHQIKELEQVPLEEEKYEELLRESSRVNNSEKLYESSSQLINVLEDEQAGIPRTISRSFSLLRILNNIDESTRPFTTILDRIQEDSSELLSALTGYIESLSFSPSEADEINRRCDIYYEILRKYGPALEDARKFYAACREKHALLADLEHNGSELSDKIGSIEKELVKSAKKMTAARETAAKGLKSVIEKELRELAIPHVRFECRVEKAPISADGRDKVSFYISPNAGETLKPMSEIVSSGEAARMMLALKKALTDVDPIPVLIFDEIDAQIGGRLGTVTGQKLKDLAGKRQVILITHLPQIASYADSHFKVHKTVRDGHTITEVSFLDQAARVKEMAKMMSGEKESRIAEEHAHEMLAKAKK